MPIYEYQCTGCGERFEIRQKFSDPQLKTCDQLSCPCGKAQPVTKVISAPAIMFKGKGWYVTDYSDKFKEPVSKAENNGQPSETKTQDGESKTDGKSKSTGSENGSSSTTPAASTPASGSSGASSSSGTSSSAHSSVSSGSRPSSTNSNS